VPNWKRLAVLFVVLIFITVGCVPHAAPSASPSAPSSPPAAGSVNLAEGGTTPASPAPSSAKDEGPAAAVKDPFQPRQHVPVRGLYLTGWSAGLDGKFYELLKYAKSSGLNAMVIDVKDDDGLITFPSKIPLAQEIGSNSHKIKDIAARVKTLKENGIYPIARIVVFVDPVLAAKRPAWAILNGKFKDRRGLAWTNPFNREVWKYNVDVAKEAVAAGFKEIQFDYVRFPEKNIPGVTEGVGKEKRVEAIAGFLRYARQELEPLGVFVSADVFGLTTTVVDDMKIGQDYATVAGIVDYICPMVYPSHYNPGLFGLKNPNANPYETVYQSMLNARKKTPDLPLEKHRPWIQDFSLYGIHYGRAEVEAQIRALAKAGIHQFILWDPSNRYTRGVDYSLIDTSFREAKGTATGSGG